MSDQTESMSKSELLDQIRTERALLEAVLEGISPQKMLLPGVDGEWSLKDVLAHLSVWERRMVRWIGMHLHGQPPDVPLPWDVERMNAETYTQVKDWSLVQVMEEYRRSYRAALALAESLDEEQLQTTFPDIWPMGPLWLGVAANTSWHYKEHREDIEKWLAKQ